MGLPALAEVRGRGALGNTRVYLRRDLRRVSHGERSRLVTRQRLQRVRARERRAGAAQDHGRGPDAPLTLAPTWSPGTVSSRSNGSEERTGLRPRYRRAFGCVTWVYMGMLVFLAANFLLVLPSRYLGSGELYGYLPPALAYLGTLLILPGMVLAALLGARTFRTPRTRGTRVGAGVGALIGYSGFFGLAWLAIALGLNRRDQAFRTVVFPDLGGSLAFYAFVPLTLLATGLVISPSMPEGRTSSDGATSSMPGRRLRCLRGSASWRRIRPARCGRGLDLDLIRGHRRLRQRIRLRQGRRGRHDPTRGRDRSAASLAKQGSVGPSRYNLSMTENGFPDRSHLPTSPGVYIFKDAGDTVIYVGKAKNVRSRVASYFNRSGDGRPKIAELRERVRQIDFISGSETEALVLEANLIKRHRPRFNASLKDDKSYPYIVVTTGDEYPRVFATRSSHDPRHRYFGPFPSAGSVHATLDVLNKTFPSASAAVQSRAPQRGALSQLPHRTFGGAVHRGHLQGGLRWDHRGRHLLSGGAGGRFDPRARGRHARGRQGHGLRAGGEAARRDLRALPRARPPAGDHRFRGLLRRFGAYTEGETACVQVFAVREGQIVNRDSFLLDNYGESRAEDVALSSSPSTTVRPPCRARSSSSPTTARTNWIRSPITSRPEGNQGRGTPSQAGGQTPNPGDGSAQRGARTGARADVG